MLRPVRFLGSRREEIPEPSGAVAVFRHHAARAMSEERWASALIFLDRILEIEPGNTETWLTKGHIQLFGRCDEQAAIACYRKVIVLGAYDTANPHVRKAQSTLERLLKRLA